MNAADPHALVNFAAGLAIGALFGLSRLVTAVSKALGERADRLDDRCRKRLRHLERWLADTAAAEGLARDPRLAKSTGELAAIGRALAHAGVPIVGGMVCGEGEYTAVFGYEEVLGHSHVEGCKWTDPRFVDPADLAASMKVSAESVVSINRGQRIYMKTAEGVRLPGRVFSAAPRTVGDRQMRFFIVVFDKGSLNGA